MCFHFPQKYKKMDGRGLNKVNSSTMCQGEQASKGFVWLHSLVTRLARLEKVRPRRLALLHASLKASLKVLFQASSITQRISRNSEVFEVRLPLCHLNNRSLKQFLYFIRLIRYLILNRCNRTGRCRD